MNQKQLTKRLSKVLCIGAYCGIGNTCLYCISEDCSDEMSDTFLEEAERVVSFLLANKVIKKSNLL